MAEELSVEHDVQGRRFRVQVSGQEAVLAYRMSGTTMDMYHTFVPEAARGKGLAEKLVKAGFEYAKANGLTVVPTCPYISGAYLKRHTEYQSLVKS